MSPLPHSRSEPARIAFSDVSNHSGDSSRHSGRTAQSRSIQSQKSGKPVILSHLPETKAPSGIRKVMDSKVPARLPSEFANNPGGYKRRKRRSNSLPSDLRHEISQKQDSPARNLPGTFAQTPTSQALIEKFERLARSSGPAPATLAPVHLRSSSHASFSLPQSSMLDTESIKIGSPEGLQSDTKLFKRLIPSSSSMPSLHVSTIKPVLTKQTSRPNSRRGTTIASHEQAKSLTGRSPSSYHSMNTFRSARPSDQSATDEQMLSQPGRFGGLTKDDGIANSRRSPQSHSTRDRAETESISAQDLVSEARVTQFAQILILDDDSTARENA